MSCNSYRVAVPSAIRDILFIISILVLSSCAFQPPVPDTEKQNLWNIRHNDLKNLDYWNLTGRMSFRNHKDAWSASLYWRESPDQYQIQIMAPLGQGGVEINGKGNTVNLSTDEGQTYQQDEIELMMLQNLGWRVPAAAMRYWVKGMPEPGSAIDEVEIDDLGRIVQLNQSGWSVSYESYTRTDGYQLPVRIDLQRDEARIRMIINYWNLSP